MSSDRDHADALQQQLAASVPGLRVDWVACTGSTNADLLAWARQQSAAQPPRLLLAGQQQAGRGRQGRPWHGAGASLLLSLAWALPPRCAVSGLSPAVGVWLAQGLQQLGCTAVRLKWPNDLLLDGAKLGGVLIELADTAAARWVVVGIGINLQDPPDGAAALQGWVQTPDRWSVLQALAPRLLDGLREWPQRGLHATTADWAALHAWQDQAVVVTDQGRTLHQGVARGIDADGCLLLDTEHGLQRIGCGDLSLRRAD